MKNYQVVVLGNLLILGLIVSQKRRKYLLIWSRNSRYGRKSNHIWASGKNPSHRRCRTCQRFALLKRHKIICHFIYLIVVLIVNINIANDTLTIGYSVASIGVWQSVSYLICRIDTMNEMIEQYIRLGSHIVSDCLAAFAEIGDFISSILWILRYKSSPAIYLLGT